MPPATLPQAVTIGGRSYALRAPHVLRLLEWYRLYTAAHIEGDADRRDLFAFAALGLCIDPPLAPGVPLVGPAPAQAGEPASPPAPLLGLRVVELLAVDGDILDAWNAADLVASALLDRTRFSKPPAEPSSSGGSPSVTATSAPPSPGEP